MGKDWYWGCSSGGGAAKSSSKRGRDRARNRDTTSTFSGCMTTVFHFFHFHHFHYCLHQPSSSVYLPAADNNSTTVLKGMEAPRNSLELEVEKLHIPMVMQIKTRASKSNDLSSEISSCSPGTKTPTLVARLMGLDLLPAADSCSSPSTNNKSHLHRLIAQRNIPGTCSLPETPRGSSSSRRSVDADRRLSLQINKENISETTLEFKSLTRKEMKYQEENQNGRQIVKQVKESVSRRVGLVDITNNSPASRRRDEELLAKSKKTPKTLESNNNNSMNSPSTDHSQEKQKQAANKCSKKVNGEERFIKKPPQTSDINIPDHNKYCNKTPSFNPSSQTVLLQSQRKQSHVCDGDGAQESRRSSRLSSCAGQKYMQATHKHNHKPSGDSEESTSVATCAAGSAQYEYVTRILKRTGIYKDTTTTTRCFSPLDPSIFHQLDTTCSTVNDRKLLLHVVDEMLVQTTCGFGHIMQGSESVDTLCAKIRSFPGKNCRAPEDIDGIIDGIVSEIDTGVLDTLLHETASMLFCIQVDGAR